MALAIAQVKLELDAALVEPRRLGGRCLGLRSRSHCGTAPCVGCPGHADSRDGRLARPHRRHREIGAYPQLRPMVLPPAKHSIVGRRANKPAPTTSTRLAQVRRQTHADLMATLAWIRELVSMIHLAKFTGAPASRAEELVAQIAAAVEGVSAVAWQDPEPHDQLYPRSSQPIGQRASAKRLAYRLNSNFSIGA